MQEKIEIRNVSPQPKLQKKKSIHVTDTKSEHEYFISEALKKKIDVLTIEINERSSLGYLAGKGAMLSGFQGTGKTELVNEMARRFNATVYSINKEMSEEEIKEVFEEARESAESKNTFVFIDEIDNFGQKESIINSSYSKIVVLMTELDGIESFRPKEIFYVFAATNYLENVDDRLLRPGRFDELIEIPLPDVKARREIIKIHQKNKSENPHKYKISDEGVEFLSRKSTGYTPADLRSLVKHACIETEKRRDPGKIVSINDAENAFNGFITSVKRGLEYFTEPEIRLDDVAGRGIYKEFLKDVLKNDDAKVLVYGPRGTGKTMMPEALAYDMEYNFIKVKGSELQEGLIGEGTKKIKKLFHRASMAAPCVVLIDEIKGIVTQRNTISYKDDETAFLNSLLSRPISGVYLFATINNPAEINETTLSRFGHKVYVELPDASEREIFIRKKITGLGAYLAEMTEKTDGFSFRDLDRMVNVLNSAEKKLIGRPYTREQLLSHIISKYTPENYKDETNWNTIKKFIGNSMEDEKLIYSIVNE